MDGKDDDSRHDGPEGPRSDGLQYKGETNVHRVGLIYFGIGNIRIGYNSEKNIRAGIQNTYHRMIHCPFWDVLDNQYPDRFYWYVGSTGGSILWY